MDYTEKVMPPLALYQVTGLSPDTFRGHKRRDIYKGLGIVSTGKISAYSIFDLTAVKCVTMLNAHGLELQEAADCVSSILPDFPGIVERARQSVAEFNASVGEIKDITPGWKAPMHWSLSGSYILAKTKQEGAQREQWHLTRSDNTRSVQEALAGLEGSIATFIDVGTIMNGVVDTLIRGGAMSAEF